MKNRIYELDLTRGILIIGMIIYHVMFDLQELYGIQTNYDGTFVRVLFNLLVPIFIVLPGINSYFSRSNIKRGIKVLLAGLIITVATYIYNKSNFVIFGILQCIGVCILLADLLKKLRFKIVFVVIFLALGFAFENIYTHSYWLLPFGIRPTSFTSIDYYPLFPALGYFTLGIIIGDKFYKNKKGYLPSPNFFEPISFIGKHAFLVYLIHQPIVLGILYLIFL